MKSLCLNHTIDVHLIFEKSSCKNQMDELNFLFISYLIFTASVAKAF